MKETPTMHKLAAIILLGLTACASAQPAPYPITINSQAPTAPQVQTFRASPITFRVQFMDGTNVANLTGSTSNDVFFSWSVSSTSSTRVAASARIYNATNGQAEFTLAASNLNYAAGRYLYECGISNAVVRQGVMLLNGSPFGTGANPISFATNVNWNLISWVNLPSYITDAPANGSTYGRKSNAWEVIAAATATNGVNSATFNEGATNGVTLAGNVLTVSFKTNYSGGTSGGITNIVNGSGLLVSGTDERTLTVTNSPLLGGLAADAFVLKSGDTISGNLVVTGGQLSVYRSAGQIIISDLTSSNSILMNASAGQKAYINFEHNEEEGRITYSADSGYDTFDFSRSTVPANFTNINNIYAASFAGSGSGLTALNAANLTAGSSASAINGLAITNVNAETLDGYHSDQIRGLANGLALGDIKMDIAHESGAVVGRIYDSRGGTNQLGYIWNGTNTYYGLTNTVTLTAGTTNVPQANFVVMTPTGVSVVASYPTNYPRTIMFETWLMDTARVAAASGIATRSWTETFDSRSERGRVAWIGERVRQEPARYRSGLAATIVTNSTTDLYATMEAGSAWQMHLASVSALASRSEMWILNGSYGVGVVTNLAQITTDSSGAAIGASAGDCFNVELMCFIQSGLTNNTPRLVLVLSANDYTTGNAATRLASALSDSSAYSVTGVSADFEGMIVRLARLTMVRGAGAGQWTIIPSDRRGAPLGTESGGTGGGEVDPLSVRLTGDTMTGALTNEVGFFGNGAGLTNLSVSGGGSLPAQTAPYVLEVHTTAEAHGTNLTAYYSSGADALLSLSTVSATNAVNFAGLVNPSTAVLVTPTYIIYNVKVSELATNFTRLRWKAIDNQGTTGQPTLTMSWNSGANFAVMTSVVSAASTSTSNGYSIAGWTNGWQGRTLQIIASFTASSTNNSNARFQGFENSQASPIFTVE